jgi:hypothetical protein
MPRRLWIALLLLTSCGSVVRRHSTPAIVPNEIFHHPSILHDSSVPRDQMTLWGVKLGDPESAIASRRILDTGREGWIKCRDGSRYRIQDDVVATLGVWDPKILARLDIKSPAQIEARFGKPDKIDDADPVMIYRYVGGKISVLWNKQEGQINAVNVSR